MINMALKLKIREEYCKRIKPILKIILCKLKKFFSVKSFSKGQMLFFCFTILVGSFLMDNLRFIIFVGFTVSTWFMGYAGLRHVRNVLEKAERVINNPTVPIDKKYVEAVGAVHISCSYLGSVMDKYNLQQGTAPYLKDLKDKEGGEKVDE